jgi:NADPH-dependent F420 reductase
MKIAIFGGTGKFGTALAHRIVASQKHELTIASRDAQKAKAAAQSLGATILGMTHADAATWCEAAVFATPYAVHSNLLESIQKELAGKIVIDAVVPLDPADPTRIRTQSGTSAAEEAAGALPASKVFAAFHSVSHRVLGHVEESHDVLVAGGDDGKATVLEFIRGLNLRPIYAGGIGVARLLECTTPLLIAINKANKTRESGIQIVGI